MIGDQIRLRLPADPAYGRVARITASSLALRLGLPFQRIDDLRLAIDEAVVLLLRDEPEDGSLSVTFSMVDHGLVVELVGSPNAPPLSSDADIERFANLVEPIVDQAELIVRAEGGSIIRLETWFDGLTARSH